MSRLTSSLMFVVMGLAAATGSLYAQSSTGTIVGTVTDSSGAVVPAAAITITNKATSIARNMAANENGGYSASALAAGDYEVKAEKQGFKTALREATVQAGGNISVNLALSVGSASEVVTIEAASAQINYESNAIQGVIDRATVQDLPLNGRSFMQLAVLEPGVTISSGSTAQFNTLFTVSVLGAGNRTAFTVDGGNISDNIDTGGGIASMNISQDVVQEFQLSSVNFDLATPISIGGAINVVTRSGTNELHGSAYFYFRDHNMSAYPGLQRQALAPDPFFARRNPGFTIGGPIKKDKLFFFFNNERVNQVQSIVSQAIGFLPHTVDALTGVFSSPYKGNQVTARVDYRLSEKHTLFARYSHDGNNGFGQVFSPQASPSNWVRNLNWADQSIIGITSTLTPRIVNDTRIQYMYWSNHNSQPNASDCVEPTCIGAGLPGLLAIIGTNLGYGSSAIGINPNAPQTRNTRRYEVNEALTWQLGNHRVKFGGDITRAGNTGQWGFCTPYCEGVLGPGFSAFGVTAPSTPITKTSDFYNLPFYSLSSGIFTGIGVGTSSQPPPYRRDESTYESQYRAFVQDTWKLRPNLTVNFGIAWNAQTGYFTVLPQSPFLAPILTPLFGSDSLGVTPNNTKDFSPAIGFAWSPGKNGKTVIRGGGGIYWDSVPGYYHNRTPAANGPVGDGRATLSSQAFLNTYPGIISNGVSLPVGAPIPVGQFTNLTLGQFDQIYKDQIGVITAKLSPVPPTSGPFTVTGIDVSKSAIEIFPPTFPVARSYQISFGVQRDLGYGYVLTADYAMRQGENLSQGELDYNLNTRYLGTSSPSPVIPACTAAQRFVVGQQCSSGAITFWTPQGRSRYNGLLMKLNKRLSHRYTFTASYQLAGQRQNTAVQDLLNRGASYAPNLARQTLNVAGTVHLMWGVDLSMNASAISKSPVTATVAGLYLPGTAPASTSGAQPLPTLPLNCLGLTCGEAELSTAVNTFNSTYAGTKNAQGGTIAKLTLPTNYALGDGILNQDFGLSKTFSVRERYKLMVKGEVFNAFNISNYSGYSFSLSSPATFGQPTARAAQTFGSAGPRAFQVAARISF